MTTATPAEQRALLTLQEQDQKIARLSTQQRKLPVLAELAELRAQALRGEQQRIEMETALADARRELAFAEGEVQLVRSRRERQQQVLDQGALAPKGLANLQTELDHLAGRQAELEDAELAAMERVEALQEELDAHTAAAADLTGQIAQAEQEALQQGGDLGVQLESAQAERAEIVAGIPAAVVQLYEQVRDRTGALAVVELRDGATQPVALDFSLAELDAIRSTPADEVYISEEYDYIIVRS
ncbi:MAG: hypothetical protein Q4B12_00045 [Bowdeniella nasicola]|nr:hypothetical protein [Bowdeniella nasicola]